MDPRETVEAYYEALRAGEPLGPFFAETGPDGDPPVKYGISERLVGRDEIVAGLGDQTRTTADWLVTSRALRVTARDCHAWFSDGVVLAWTDTDRGIRFEFDTRWSGTLESVSEDRTEDGPSWRFVGMHVSTASDV